MEIKNVIQKFRTIFGGDGKDGDARKKLGDKGETLATKHYQKQGFLILERNYRCPIGELDIVARKENLLVFCEVKTRRSESFGPPEMAVNAAKRRRIIKLANYYIKQKRLESLQVRFDIVSVYWEKGGRPEIRHIPAAFNA